MTENPSDLPLNVLFQICWFLHGANYQRIHFKVNSETKLQKLEELLAHADLLFHPRGGIFPQAASTHKRKVNSFCDAISC